MSFRGQRFAVLSLVIGLSMAAPLGAMPAHAADATSADVQWAQTILKSKGLYSGRANGDLNEPTRDALRAYQKSAGLKQTGQLDAATSGHMLAARQTTAQPTMGNLAGPGGKPQPSQINRNVEPPKPLASPTTRVEAHGSEFGRPGAGRHRTFGRPVVQRPVVQRRTARALGNPARRAVGSGSRTPAFGLSRPRSRRAGPAGCSPHPSRLRRSGSTRRNARSSRPGGNRPYRPGLGAFGGHRRAGRRFRLRRIHLLAQRPAAVPLPHRRVARGYDGNPARAELRRRKEYRDRSPCAARHPSVMKS